MWLRFHSLCSLCSLCCRTAHLGDEIAYGYADNIISIILYCPHIYYSARLLVGWLWSNAGLSCRSCVIAVAAVTPHDFIVCAADFARFSPSPSPPPLPPLPTSFAACARTRAVGSIRFMSIRIELVATRAFGYLLSAAMRCAM